MVFSTRRPIMYVHTRWGLSKPLVAIVHATLLATVAISCFFLIPAAIFSALEENWNFLESFYFCFISLSTIALETTYLEKLLTRDSGSSTKWASLFT
ncbi:hypothetical protein INR49_009868 [Caranx melampygus]|nr:hypothetical protein INR49_009868 [Caranx melampygus]